MKKILKSKQLYCILIVENVVKGGNMKDPKVLYILISLFCIFAIIAGIYAQFIDADMGGLNVADEPAENVVPEPTQEEIKSHFSNLLTNTLNLGGFDTTGIQKQDMEKEIVYTAFAREETADNYDININIPLINIRSELANSLNQITQADFVNKANDIISNTESDIMTRYSVDYAAYVNGNVLSLVIRSTLKEGDSAQRIIVRTYNYNLDTNTQATLNDLITMKRLNRDDVNNKIIEVCTEANQNAQTLQNMGYNEIFMRDLTSEIYNVDNAGAYFLGPNGELYIVYAYGNSDFTSEMDIILFGEMGTSDDTTSSEQEGQQDGTTNIVSNEISGEVNSVVTNEVTNEVGNEIINETTMPQTT